MPAFVSTALPSKPSRRIRPSPSPMPVFSGDLALRLALRFVPCCVSRAAHERARGFGQDLYEEFTRLAETRLAPPRSLGPFLQRETCLTSERWRVSQAASTASWRCCTAPRQRGKSALIVVTTIPIYEYYYLLIIILFLFIGKSVLLMIHGCLSTVAWWIRALPQ